MKYNLDRQETLAVALDICAEYARGGMRLTVRQLYYQIVARGLETNGDHVYKRLVSVLTDARLSGDFPMDYLEDRGRSVTQSDVRSSLCVDRALSSIARDIRTAPARMLWAGRWFGQPVVPFVWVEKDALTGVFEGPCGGLDVGLFACKGYPSIQALWSFVEGVAERLADEAIDETARDVLDDIGIDADAFCEEVVVLYFGDHDPDGLEIPESAERNIEQLVEAHGDDLPFQLPRITFRRVALTIEQIRQHNPPPFPAKRTSSRFDAYYARTGLRQAWELDALDPGVLRALVAEHVNEYVDEAIMSHVRRVVVERQTTMRSTMKAPGWAARAVEDVR